MESLHREASSTNPSVPTKRERFEGFSRILLILSRSLEFVDILNGMRFGQLTSQAAQKFMQLSRPVSYDDGIEPTEMSEPMIPPAVAQPSDKTLIDSRHVPRWTRPTARVCGRSMARVTVSKLRTFPDTIPKETLCLTRMHKRC